MKKIYALFLLLIVGFTASFTACGDPYKNMKLEIISQKSITIELSNDKLNEDGEIDSTINTSIVEAKISGVKGNVSKVVNFVSSDTSKLLVVNQSTEGDTTTAIIEAIATGSVQLLAISEEGSLSETINVNIVRKVFSISFSSDYKPAVLVGETGMQIDTSKLIYEPQDVNNLELNYSIVEDVEGVTIDNGRLIVTNENLDFVTVRVQPVIRKSDEVYADIQVKVLKNIDVNLLHVYSKYFTKDDIGTDSILGNEYNWIKNKEETQTISFDYDNADIFNNLRIKAIITDTDATNNPNDKNIIENYTLKTNNSLSLNAVDIGTTQIEFIIYYEGYEDIVVYSSLVDYTIVDAVKYISVNDNVSSVDIYNKDISNVFKGTDVTIKLSPDSASNLKYKFVFPEGIEEHIIITTASGGNPYDNNGYINSGIKLKFSHDGQLNNQTFDLGIETSGAYIGEPFTFQVNCLTIVNSIIIDPSLENIMLGYSQELQLGTTRDIYFDVAPTGANKDSVIVLSNNNNIAVVNYDEVTKTYYVEAKGIGNTTLSFMANDRVLKTINVECVAPYSGFLVDIDSKQVNENVRDKKMVDVYGENSIELIGQTLSNAVIKAGSRIKLYVNSYPSYSKLKSISYKLEGVEGDINLVSIDNDGILFTTGEVAKFNVIVEVVGYYYDVSGTGDVVEISQTKTIEFTSINPIESISLNKYDVTISDINTVGIDEISQAQVQLYVNINPTNATIDASNIEWSTSSEFQDLLEVQSDGSVIITGRLKSGDKRTFKVQAKIIDYSVVHTVECQVTVVREKTVENILLYNYDNARGIYLKSSDVNAGFNGDSYQIFAKPSPADAKNTKFKYFAFDINAIDDSIEGWYWDESLYTRVDSSRIQVNEDGLITTVDKAGGGYSVVWVVPADNIRSNPIDFSQIKIKRVLLVYVADGTIENPYDITNYEDFLNISKAPDKAYRITQTIDFSRISNYTPIGTVDKPFTGSLTGKYTLSNGKTIINSIINFGYNSTVNQSSYQGLFGVVGEGATIGDLNVSIRSSAIDVELSSDDNYSFGVIAGLNNGTISNVAVTFVGNLEIINDGQATIYIGGLVGENTGEIVNCRSLTYKQFGIVINESKTDTYAGGLVGLNSNKIVGEFKYVGDLLNAQSGDIQINVDYNDEAVNSSIYLTSNFDNVYLGGVVALNDSVIDGVYSKATLSNLSNIGGVISVNNGNAKNLRFTGSIKGNNSVGGIAGQNALNGTITFGIVEICDDLVHFSNFNNSQINKFGGVVGENIGTIQYSYINSYSAQRLENNVNCDINFVVTDVANIISFGTFVGENSGTINKCFDNVQIVELALTRTDLFFGANNSNITNSYSLSYLGDFTTTNQTIINGNIDDENNFITKSGMNFGKPMIVIDKSIYDDAGDVLLTQSPQSINVAVIGTINYSSFGKDDATNRYYKVSDTRLILLLNNSLDNEELNNNDYDISKMFDITISPSSQRSNTIIVSVISGNDVVKIEGTKLTVLKEGYAVLRFASDLDSAVYKDIEVYVTYGITDVNVQNISQFEENNQIYNILKLRLNARHSFKIDNINSLVTGDIETQYQALQSGGYLFNFDIANFVEFDKSVVESDSRSYYVNYADGQIMTALMQGESNVVINPFISAKFYENDTLTEIKYVFKDIAYEFILEVYQGIMDISTQNSSEKISPSDSLNYNVKIHTDLEDSVLDSLKIYKGQITQDSLFEEYDLTSSTLAKTITKDFKFSMNILEQNFDADNNEKNIVFEITPSRELNGDKAILQTEEYILVFSATKGDGTKVSKQFRLVIEPQSLSNILINYYNDGEYFDPYLTGAGEEVSTKIIPGQYGLLVVNVWPEYSIFDRLEVTSSIVANDVITFEQMYYNIDNNNYDTRVQNVQIIENGISVQRQSTKKWDEDNNTYIYSFDGKIYIRTITGSNVPTGQKFIITVKAYRSNESMPYITKSLELETLQAPYLDVTIKNGQSYKGITNQHYVADNMIYNFDVVVDSTTNLSDISTVITDKEGNVVNNVTSYFDTDFVVSNNKKVLKFNIDNTTEGGFELGEKYNLEIIVSKNINGIVTKSRIIKTLNVVDFLITGFDIVDASLSSTDSNYILVSNGLLSRPLSTDGWQIAIKLKTLGGNVDAIQSVENKLNGIETLYGDSSYYNPWKYLVMSGVNAGMFETINNENVSNNFVLSRNHNGYNLTGKTIANVDTLMADFSYYYDTNGNLTLVGNNPTISTDGSLSMKFRLDFSLSSSQDNPLPIYTKDDFLNMEEGLDYILLNDIDLGINYEPINTKINSLDGNGYAFIIRGYQLPLEQTDSINLGLFGVVDTNTLLKNITVNYYESITLDLRNYKNVYFGTIAGENKGIITNASVNHQIGTSGDTGTTKDLNILVKASSEEGENISYIGGAIGLNTGIVTNSQVNNLKLTSSGTIGGFVANNQNVVSSSYVYAPTIQSSSGETGGFVALNTGAINTSFVRGTYKEIRTEDAILNVMGKAGGFVYQNTGTIDDCYANIKITSQSRSAGFVYENTAQGQIYNCLSLSNIIQNSIAHMPFVGTDDSDRFLNQGILTNAYFYQNENDKFVTKDNYGQENPAQKMTEEDLKLESSLLGFAFSSSEDEFSGVWVQPMINNYNYFKSNNRDSNLGFKVGVPELVAPNVVAKSVRRIDTIITDENTGETVYNYIYVTDSNNNGEEIYGYEYGSRFNQALIRNVDDFVYTYEKYNNGQLVENSNIYSRIINNIDFGTYQKTLNTTKVSLQANIEGNGLSLNNISIVSEVDEKLDEFGLFKNIRGNTNSIASIKNLTLSYLEVKSSSTSVVGSLAGSMHNANLIDVEVVGENVTVLGSNIVGGVVGLVTGNSNLYRIKSNISANAGYRNSGNNTLVFDDLVVENAKNILYVNDSLFYSGNNEYTEILEGNPLKDTTNYVSYAGAVAGVVETKHKDSIMECYMLPNVFDITVDGSVKVVGTTAGGVIGMAGLYTYVSNVNFIISNSSYITGIDIAGGLIGELRGKLSQSSIKHINQEAINNLAFGQTSDDINLNFFKSNTTTKASGGLVGLNLGGTILDCISNAYVTNPYSQYSGGAVGVTISGDIKAVIASGSVVGKEAVGGLIGGILATKGSGDGNFYNYQLLPLYYNNLFNVDNELNFEDEKNSMVLGYVMAGNNWTVDDQNKLKSIKYWGGLIGYFDPTLSKTYIVTTHPQDADSDVNLINFYVAGNNDTSLLNSCGNEKSDEIGGEWIHIAEPIKFVDLNIDNKELYFGSYYRFVWDLTNNSKFPTIVIKAVPDVIEVANAKDLLQIIWNLSADYLIVDDIDLSKIDSWLPLGSNVEPFSGTLRSKVKVQDPSTVTTRNTYYEIQNLRIVASNMQHVGLFGVTGINYKTKQGAVFENLVITVDEIIGKDFGETESFVGALVGEARGTTINNVLTTPASIDSAIISSSNYTGGIVGRMSNLNSSFFVDDDETKGNIVFKSSMNDCLSNVNIGILIRDDSNVTPTNVGGAIGQILAGEVNYTVSNQTITLAQSIKDENGKVTSYKLLGLYDDNIDTTNSQDLIIGGLVGSNGSQTINAGANTEDNGEQATKITNSFSTSNIEIANINYSTTNTIGGFIGVLDENGGKVSIDSCFAIGNINVKRVNNSLDVEKQTVLSGFVGKINLKNESSTNTLINECYSLVSIVDQTALAKVKGLGLIALGDKDLTDQADSKIMQNSYFEQYYALIEEDKNYGKSSQGILDTFNSNNYSIGAQGAYYPVLKKGDYYLGLNDRSKEYCVFNQQKGSRINPILIEKSEDFYNLDKVDKNSNINYLLTADIESVNYEDSQGFKLSDNSVMLEEVNGFINGNGHFVNNFNIVESPVSYDENDEVIEDNSEVKNVGLIKVLKKGSVISGLNLSNVNIDYQDKSTIDNSTINVGALVGYLEDGAVVFGCSVTGNVFVKGAQYKTKVEENEVINSRNQTLNIGGLIGYSNGGNIFSSANYATVASFDYREYKNVATSSIDKALDTLNIGGLVGKIDNLSFVNNVYSISQINVVQNSNYVNNTNYGSLIGYSRYSTINNWYAKVDLIEKENTFASKVAKIIGSRTDSGATDNNIVSDERDMTPNNNPNYNYGYETFRVFYNNSDVPNANIPRSTISTQNGAGESVTYKVPNNTETLIYLLENDYYVLLQQDLYLDSNLTKTIDTYQGQINGNGYTIYGVDKKLIENVEGDARIENLAIVGTENYQNDNSLFGSIANTVTINNVDLTTAKYKLKLANEINTTNLTDVSAIDTKVVTTTDKWINTNVNENNVIENDKENDRLRSFVKYWSQEDLRGVYLDEVTVQYSKDELIIDEDRYRINDVYQLLKFSEMAETDKLSYSKIAEINAQSTIDLDGKIWDGLQNFSHSLVSSDTTGAKKPIIKNLYTEGKNNVGFIDVLSVGTDNVAKLSNLTFENAKLVLHYNEEEAGNKENFGVIAGKVSSGEITSIDITGIININVPEVNNVGIAFGSIETTSLTLNNISASGKDEDIEKSIIRGLDFVGGIAGNVGISNVSIRYFNNNYNISGRDFVGGYFGYTHSDAPPTIYGYDDKTQYNNSGNISGRNFVGGIIGYNTGVSLHYLCNTGNVTSGGYAVGGIVGYTNRQLVASTNGSINTITAVQYSELEYSKLESNETAKNILDTFNYNAYEGIIDNNNANILQGYEVIEGTFYGGLIGYLDNASILISNNSNYPTKNLNYANVSAENFVGGFVGFNKLGNIYGTNSYLQASNFTNLTNLSTGSVTGQNYVGGIVGFNYSNSDGNGIVKDCVVDVNQFQPSVVGANYIGGIVGANYYGYVWTNACAAILKKDADATSFNNVGGIVGYNAGEIQYVNSSVYMTLTIDDLYDGQYIGGIAGKNDGIIKNSIFNKGNSDASNKGSIILDLEELTNSVIIPKVYIGGITGYNNGDIETSYTDVGILFQVNWDTTETDVNSIYSKIYSSINIGGITAYNSTDCTISDCYSLATIQNVRPDHNAPQGTYITVEPNTDTNVSVGGGLVHTNYGSIISSYAMYNICSNNSGTISDDCFVMQNVGGQLSVKSNYQANYMKFLENKFILKSISISKDSGLEIGIEEVGFEGKVSKVNYPSKIITLQYISRDGKYSDTEVLVNNNSIQVDMNGIDQNLIKCQCDGEGDKTCICSEYGCCEDCACYDSIKIIKVYNCKYTHEQLLRANYNSTAQYYNQVFPNLFNNVIFRLSFTGMLTQSNASGSSVDNSSTAPSTVPSTGFMGNGSPNDPYRIYSVNDIDTINRQLNFGNTYSGDNFILMNDLDLSGYNGGLTIGTKKAIFEGTIDGNGKKIIGNVIDGSTDNIGLFPYLGSSAVIKNIIFVNCQSLGSSTYDNVGIVAGTNNGKIENIKILSNNDANYSKVSGQDNIGGIAGVNNSSGRIIGCSVSADVSGTQSIGGIAGYNEGLVSLCESVSINYNSDSYNVGKIFNIQGNTRVGGIVGTQSGNGSVNQCSNENAVSSINDNECIGGIVGYSDSSIPNGNVIEDVINRGAVTGTKGNIGQIAGHITNGAVKNALGLSNAELFVNIDASVEKSNCYIYSSFKYQINGFKRDYYKGFDFVNTWGMSATQFDGNQTYTNPKVNSISIIDDNYPRLLGLNSSKYLIAEHSFFKDQYFNENDIGSTSPIMYIETQLQLEYLMHYFLGEYEGNSNYSSTMTIVKNNEQYNYTSGTYKLVKTGINIQDSSIAYKNEQVYGTWSPLPAITNRNIDFNNVTFKIGTYGVRDVSSGDGFRFGGFISVFGNTSYNVFLGNTTTFELSNLNIEVENLVEVVNLVDSETPESETPEALGGIVARAKGAEISNCKVNWTNQSTTNNEGQQILTVIEYSGDYLDDAKAGSVVADIQDGVTITGCTSNLKSGNFSGYKFNNTVNN